MTIWLAEVMKASRASCASSTVKGRSSSFRSCAAQHVEHHGARNPSQDRVVGLAGDHLAVAGDDPGIGRGAFGDGPSLATNQASRAPCSRAACLASTFGRSAIDLMSTRSQRLSGSVMTAMPSAAIASVLAGSMLLAVTTMAGLVPAGGNAWSRLRDAARDLQIDDAVAHAVARAPPHAARRSAPKAASAARCAIPTSERCRAAPCAGARRSGGLPSPRRLRRRRRRIDSRDPRYGRRRARAADSGR